MDIERHLVENAHRFAASGATPVPARLAATVLLLRPPFEVYLLRRARTMAFAAGMYAFPGGGVDPRDRDVDWVAPAHRLGLPDAEARAVACAAVREVFEETGILLAGRRGPAPRDAAPPDGAPRDGAPRDGAPPDDAPPDGAPRDTAPPDGAPLDGALRDDGPEGDTAAADLLPDVSGPEWEQARRAVEAREIGFAQMLDEHGLVLRADLLVPWSRWITPEFEPRRFDTYFFVAPLPVGQRTRRVGREASHAVWRRPDQATDLPMLPPTRANLAQLAGYRSIAAALAADHDVSAPVTPRVVGDRLVYPRDEAPWP